MRWLEERPTAIAHSATATEIRDLAPHRARSDTADRHHHYMTVCGPVLREDCAGFLLDCRAARPTREWPARPHPYERTVRLCWAPRRYQGRCRDRYSAR